MELINDFNHLDNKYSKKINIIKYGNKKYIQKNTKAQITCYS